MKITVENDYGDKLDMVIESADYAYISNITRSMLEFLTYNAEAVCEHIADTQREV